MTPKGEIRTKAMELLQANGVDTAEVYFREYPEETILIVEISDAHKDVAIQLTGKLDEILRTDGIEGFTTVRVSRKQASEASMELTGFGGESSAGEASRQW